MVANSSTPISSILLFLVASLCAPRWPLCNAPFLLIFVGLAEVSKSLGGLRKCERHAKATGYDYLWGIKSNFQHYDGNRNMLMYISLIFFS